MRDERGAALVETAMVLTFLLIVVLGVVDFGRALAMHIAVRDASQEGSLVAAFAPAESTRIVDQTLDAGASVPIEVADIAIICGFSPATVTVEVTHELDLVTPIIGPMFGGSISLVGSETATVFSSDQTCVAVP